MLTFDNTDGLDAVASLDVALLQDRILAPILGIGDPRTDERIDFVGGIKGTDELEKIVDSGKAAVAFSMYPTTTDQLMAIADAGQIMPPKSTWFEPKLRSGLLFTPSRRYALQRAIYPHSNASSSAEIGSMERRIPGLEYCAV